MVAIRIHEGKVLARERTPVQALGGADEPAPRSLHMQQLIRQIKGAISEKINGVDIDMETDALASLSFVHPAHRATVLIIGEQGDTRQPVPTVAVFVLIDDWLDVQKDPTAVTRLLQLNTALMSCAIGVVQLNDDEMATALCRRLPAADVDPATVLDLIEGMVWEYANAAGFIESAEMAAVAEA